VVPRSKGTVVSHKDREGTVLRLKDTDTVVSLKGTVVHHKPRLKGRTKCHHHTRIILQVGCPSCQALYSSACVVVCVRVCLCACVRVRVHVLMQLSTTPTLVVHSFPWIQRRGGRNRNR
jgi:hypothetical protein